MDQEVLCIKTEKLFAKGKWQGLQKNDLDYYYQLLLNESEFKVRGPLEEDDNYKQIIAQIILRHQDRYFLYKQVNASEARLQQMMPLFLGGHIEKFDAVKGKDLVEAAIDRELDEEVFLNANIIKKEFLGLIYIEDGNFVNHVHVGLAYVFDIDSTDVKIKETDVLEDVGFVDKKFLLEHKDKLTYWSRIILDILD